MKKIKYLNPCEITAAITAAGNVMAKNLSDEELNFLAAAFMQLADVLATISAVRELNAANCPAPRESATDGRTESSDPTPPSDSS